MFRTILFQKLRIKISSTHLDVRFSRVEGEMGWGNGATGNFWGKVRAEEIAGGVWIGRAGLPKTFPNMPFILSFRICYRIRQDHRQLLAESTKWIIGPQEGTVVEAKWELWRGRVWGFPQTGSRFILVNHALILHASEFRPPFQPRLNIRLSAALCRFC